MKSEKAESHLGNPGTLISWSKSSYARLNPGNLVVFNANVIAVKKTFFKKAAEKIWYGDVDVTVSRETLKNLAKDIKQPVLVLREMDARFHNEDAPVINNFVYKVYPDGKEELGENYFMYDIKTLSKPISEV